MDRSAAGATRRARLDDDRDWPRLVHTVGRRLLAMDTATMQRVRSHGAALGRDAFELARVFIEAVGRHAPSLGGRARPTDVRRVAHRWAWLVRHLGELDHLTPELEALASIWRARGLSGADLGCVRAALLTALKAVSGAAWTEQHERDWRRAFDAGARAAGLGVPNASGVDEPMALAA